MPRASSRFRKHGLAVYGTFVFGYDNDDRAVIERSVEFAREQKLFLAAFNHLVPFPGTPLYRRLEPEGRLLKPNWWLDPREPGRRRHVPPEAGFAGGIASAVPGCTAAVLLLGLDPGTPGRPPGQRPFQFDAWHLPGPEHQRPLRHRSAAGAASRGGTWAVGATRMIRYRIDLAGPGDDADLRHILAATPMPGEISVSFRREPSYFAGPRVDGRFRQIVACSATSPTGRLVGFGCRSLMPALSTAGRSRRLPEHSADPARAPQPRPDGSGLCLFTPTPPGRPYTALPDHHRPGQPAARCLSSLTFGQRVCLHSLRGTVSHACAAAGMMARASHETKSA